MKKVILCSLITISMAFGVDCGAMIKRYVNANKPVMLFKSCTDNNNADACFCIGAFFSRASMESQKTGDYKEADEYYKAAIGAVKLACNLGKREACAMLDLAGME